uniref:glutathione transferase n=1 Tax=Oryza glumipatula TaxID=40148 RepID=A0A0E0BCX6_9ORYZ
MDKAILTFDRHGYDYVEEDFKNKSDVLLSSNPVRKKVPVLIHKGKPICESQVIVQYIDEVFPDAGVTLLPADPHDRAVARFWAAYIDEKLFSAWILVFRSKTEEEKAEAVKQTFAVVEKLEGALSECSKGKPFFGGDTVGYVDVVLGGFVAWVHAIEEVFGLNQFDAAKTPLLAAWLERFDELDAVKEVMPDIGRLVELAKMRQAQAAAAAAAAAAMAGGGDDLKMLGVYVSPFPLRVKLALSFKGLSFEYVEEDLHNKSDLLVSSNPVHKRTPVLIHNGKPISESMVIVQYLDEAFPGAGAALLPSDPLDRAVARFWASYIDDKLFSAWKMVFKGKTEEEKAEGRKQTFAVAETLEGALRECSKGKPFFGGDAVGYVDVALGGFVPWVHAMEELFGLKQFDAAKTPLLAAWLERVGELEAYKAVMPDAGMMIEILYQNITKKQSSGLFVETADFRAQANIIWA